MEGVELDRGEVEGYSTDTTDIRDGAHVKDARMPREGAGDQGRVAFSSFFILHLLQGTPRSTWWDCDCEFSMSLFEVERMSRLGRRGNHCGRRRWERKIKI